MMNIDMIPLLSFVLVTTFTPGPNNISSASMGVLYGYRKTLPYLVGITLGFCVVMFVCACLTNTLLTAIPKAEKVLRLVGAGYIGWLAIGMLKSNFSIPASDTGARALTMGALLQLCNPNGGRVWTDAVFDLSGPDFRPFGLFGFFRGPLRRNLLHGPLHLDFVWSGHRASTQKSCHQNDDQYIAILVADGYGGGAIGFTGECSIRTQIFAGGSSGGFTAAQYVLEVKP